MEVEKNHSHRMNLYYAFISLLGSGTIEKWYKKEGDIIKRDEVLCDIRTEVCGNGIHHTD